MPSVYAFTYLRDNPHRLVVRQLFPELFMERNDLCLKLPLSAEDRPLCSVLGAGAPSFNAHFSAIGNLFLLDSPNIIQVRCSHAYLAYKRVPKSGGRQRERLIQHFEDKLHLCQVFLR